MYKLLRPVLFLFYPELAHTIALSSLKLLYKIKLLKFFFKPYNTNCTINAFGLNFKNSVGIAAGLDKNGDYIDCLAALGVGFIEVGAVTPKAQLGNEKPRLFRLKQEKALINRMGFNNKGVDYLVNNLRKRTSNCIVGVNLGKNKQTPLAMAKEDYAICLEKVYQYADFVTINISSPNTPDLRKLQDESYLSDLLLFVLKKRESLCVLYKKRVPVLVKVSPDLSDSELFTVLDTLNKLKIDGIIATNTSSSRINVVNSPLANEQGGLSGQPIKDLSFKILEQINNYKLNNLEVISSGGIDSASEAIHRLNNGAKLIQIYTGLVYDGPNLLKQCIEASDQI